MHSNTIGRVSALVGNIVLPFRAVTGGSSNFQSPRRTLVGIYRLMSKDVPGMKVSVVNS